MSFVKSVIYVIKSFTCCILHLMPVTDYRLEEVGQELRLVGKGGILPEMRQFRLFTL